ncbi:hypothetical protein FRC03_010792 [Tulasnella sp. 419]|nr:hypothetical protein FRC02_001274 [Tulasnella sp. 418]KAG8967044.1 hypothetical protein FRC03_010792 [Tulasnella sp. 419]
MPVHLYGRNLADHKALKIALTSFYGVGRQTALRVMARFQIHEHIKVGELTEAQISSLTSYLSSPSNVIDPMSSKADEATSQGAAGSAGIYGKIKLARPGWVWDGNHGALASREGMSGTVLSAAKEAKEKKTKEDWQRPDPLASLLVENEARRAMRESIAHHRNIGNHRGRRHAMGLPVRGQRTKSNAKTARKLNRVERRA